MFGWLVMLSVFSPIAGAFDPLPTHAVFDSGCDTEINLQAQGGPLERVEVRDQADENECYAEAASQMVDAWRFSHGDSRYDHQTSGIALAIQTNSDLMGTGISRPEISLFGTRVLSSYEAGEACMAVDTARRHGSCDSAHVLSRLGGGSVSTTVETLRRHYDDYHAWLEEHDTLSEQLRVVLTGEESHRHRVSCDISRSLETAGVASEMRPPLEVIERLLDESNPIDYLEGMLTHACAGSATLRPDLPSCARGLLTDSQTAYSVIRERLTSNRQPVAIGFCSGMLREGRKFETGVTGRLPALGRFALPHVCRPHQALVAGLRRHPESGKCQFLIRNSWGPGCPRSMYSGDWECSNGSVWVDAQNLSYNTFGYSALE